MGRDATSSSPAYFIPSVCVPQGDGSVLVKPGRPALKMTVAEAAKVLRRSVDTIYRLYRSGVLTGERPSPNGILIDADSVRRLCEASRDPEFWDDAVRRAGYRTGTKPATKSDGGTSPRS
jgi:excisionase family DNA binding protein